MTVNRQLYKYMIICTCAQSSVHVHRHLETRRCEFAMKQHRSSIVANRTTHPMFYECYILAHAAFPISVFSDVITNHNVM